MNQSTEPTAIDVGDVYTDLIISGVCDVNELATLDGIKDDAAFMEALERVAASNPAVGTWLDEKIGKARSTYKPMTSGQRLRSDIVRNKPKSSEQNMRLRDRRMAYKRNRTRISRQRASYMRRVGSRIRESVDVFTLSPDWSTSDMDVLMQNPTGDFPPGAGVAVKERQDGSVELHVPSSLAENFVAYIDADDATEDAAIESLQTAVVERREAAGLSKSESLDESATIFSAKHYVKLADTIGVAIAFLPKASRDRIIGTFTTVFGEDNAKFKKDTFIRAVRKATGDADEADTEADDESGSDEAVIDEAADQFVKGYLTAALWSSYDDDGSSFDSNYGVEDIASSSATKAKADCDKFQRANKKLLDAAYASDTYVDGDRYDASSAGHDFWLSRNGHGAGFFDRGDADFWDELQDAARKFGNVDPYVGDDGELYIESTTTESDDEDEDDAEPESDDEPGEGDITSEDDKNWYQYGKLYHRGDRASLKRKMDRDNFHPNVFTISDHGNSILISGTKNWWKESVEDADEAEGLTATKAVAAIKAMGMKCRYNDGEFQINTPRGNDDTAYYTSDPQDAVDTAKQMKAEHDETYADEAAIDESLNDGDKKVLKAFAEKKAASSKRLTTDGKRLDINGIGGNGVAMWVGDKVKAGEGRPSGVLDQSVLRALKKFVAKNDMVESADAPSGLSDLESPTPEGAVMEGDDNDPADIRDRLRKVRLNPGNYRKGEAERLRGLLESVAAISSQK